MVERLFGGGRGKGICTVQLRPYQEDIIARVRRVMLERIMRVLLVLATGAGKTRIGVEMVSRASTGGRRVLWLAHRAELVDQAADTLIRAGMTVGAACATAQTPPNPFALVQVASVQTLLARNQRPPADLIIADEAHHFADSAETFAALLRDYPKAFIVGLTATPERGDGCGLSGCFDRIVVGATIRELTEQGYLVPCEVMRPERPLKAGELAQNPVDAYVEHAPGRSAIVFTRTVQLANEYAAEFTLRGIAAKAVSAETPWAERRLYLDAFKRGTIKVLLSVGVLTEGFDAPNASCCIMARGCGSAGLFLQCVGRILRPSPGKRDAVLLDLRGVSHEHGRPDDEREFSLDGRGIRLKDGNSYCPVCGAPRCPPDACTSCGYVGGTGDEGGKPDKIVGEKLVPYAWKRNEDDGARARTLARWIAAARNHVPPYKDGWWRNKFRAVYAVDASSEIIGEALAIYAGAKESAA